MSYWNHHPELLDEITTRHLPDNWREEVEGGRAFLRDVPVEILFKAMDEAISDYWGSKVDGAQELVEASRTEEGEEDDGIF